MGGSNFSSEAYATKSVLRASAGVAGRSTMHTKAVSEGKAPALHDKMSPMGVKVRESRDSAVHPNSTGVIFLLDVTGSMGQVPVQIQKHLPVLPETLVKGGHLPDAAIMMMAVGDAYCDTVPLQVGQFESGNEMDEDLDRLYIEGGGSPGHMGGHESYELGMYFAARHTAMDCLEKRNRKGYLFIACDEMPYDVVKRDQVKRIMGPTAEIEADIPLDEIVAELKKKFHVYVLIAPTASGQQPAVRQRWQQLFGENVIMLPSAEQTAKLVADCIAANEEAIGKGQVFATADDDAGGDDADADDHGSGGTATATKPAVKKPGKAKRL